MPDTRARFDCSGQALPINWEERISLGSHKFSRADMLKHIARTVASSPFLHHRYDVAMARDLLLVAGEDELADRCIKHD